MKLTINNRDYQLPEKPVVYICMDGTSKEYFEAAHHVMPNLERIRQRGTSGIALSVIPSFTNPNNLSLVTGVPPAVHGISGNFYYDRDADREIMMNDPAFLRCPTVLAGMAAAGKSVAVVTTKDKLRRLLGKDLKGICFSIECAHEATEAENGISDIIRSIGRPAPGVYDPECSVYCLEAGAWLLQQFRPDVLYLSTTDYVQHKFAPDAPEALDFYARIDHFLGMIDDQDVILGITADHGMNSKTNEDGSPRVRFLETILLENGITRPRVILPITDPYVVHHGALGSFATVYVAGEELENARTILRAIHGVELVLTRDDAVERFSLPADRIGDLVVLGNECTVLGRTPEWHDLSSVSKGLRSHGGLHEQAVPFIINQPIDDKRVRLLRDGRVRNYDILEFLCNGVDAQ
ncbi:MAG: phosphonoacetate hydrolase [Gemmatimonadota bacterium]|jgi:phosphonoacetate hydrolase|nr:phosphonoacetate hydrolase [Gemmatimonadota bacterium]